MSHHAAALSSTRGRCFLPSTYDTVIPRKSCAPRQGSPDADGCVARYHTVPNETSSAFYPSGVRIGTPLVTTRGMKEVEMKQVARWIARVVELVKGQRLREERQERAGFVREFKKRYQGNGELEAIRNKVKELASGYPSFRW